jgi:large subunit ribosomal protein L21
MTASTCAMSAARRRSIAETVSEEEEDDRGCTLGLDRRGDYRNGVAARGHPSPQQQPGACRMLYSRALRFLQGGREHRAAAEYRLEGADMYAVIKTGGKQYKVAAGEKIKIEQIAAEVGQEIMIDQGLAIGSGADLQIGTPLVAGASVKATVVAQGRHDKVHIFKMRRRKHYQKRQGHRQAFTELEISAVTA